MFGLFMGVTGHGWGTGTALGAVLFGFCYAGYTWFSPGRPRGVSEDVWDALSRPPRRAVRKAIERDQPLADSVGPRVAADVAGTIQLRLTWLDHVFGLLSVGAMVALVVLSPSRGAPPGWTAAGCAWLALSLVVGVRSRVAQ